ncbi:MAG: hypothetical protein AB7P18_31235 [Candidatus Binatia bacterium]
MLEFHRLKAIAGGVFGWLGEHVEQQLRQGLEQTIEERIGLHQEKFWLATSMIHSPLSQTIPLKPQGQGAGRDRCYESGKYTTWQFSLHLTEACLDGYRHQVKNISIINRRSLDTATVIVPPPQENPRCKSPALDISRSDMAGYMRILHKEGIWCRTVALLS